MLIMIITIFTFRLILLATERKVFWRNEKYLDNHNFRH